MTGPQFIEGPFYVDPRHLLAPRQVEIGVVHRLRWSIGRVGRGCDGLIRELRPLERSAGFRDFLRITRDAAQHNPRSGDLFPFPLYPGGDAKYRKIKRTAPP